MPARDSWQTVFILGAAALALAIAGAGLLRRRSQAEDEVTLSESLDALLADSLHDLLAEKDPRRAVIRAYARMERTFAAAGLPREQAQAPYEYLERVLRSVNVSANSARKLTQLFERAKFSLHTIDARMKEDAIAALVGLRAELEHGARAA
jgi:Domain of unknown function (DUF4129)